MGNIRARDTGLAILAAAMVASVAIAATPLTMRFDDGVLRLQANQAIGTGVAIGPNLIVSAAHVMQAARKGLTADQAQPPVQVSSLTIATQQATMSWMNAPADLAAIVPSAPLRVTRQLVCRPTVPGEPITIVGYPAIGGVHVWGPTITQGIVATYPQGTRLEVHDAVILDAKVQPGNSGGPVFDARGRVVGIAVAMFGERIMVPPRATDRRPDGAGPAPDREYFAPNSYTMMVPSTVLCRLLGRT